MKVLHLINGDLYSGAERVQDLLALNLPAFGYEVDFAQCRQARDAQFFNVTMRSRLDIRTAWKIARLLDTGDYQLLHTHTARSAMVGSIAAALAQRPMVHQIHSPTARDTQVAWRNIANTTVERLCLGSARNLIAVSKSLQVYLERSGFPEQLVSVVPNGVPVLERQVDWHPPTGPWVLGSIGLFRPRKGIEVLINALHLLVQRGLDVRLRLIGGFEAETYRHVLVNLAVRLGVMERIDWFGFTPDVGAELAQMNLFVLPSLYGEGLPMALIEAMAAGLPVIATAVEGCREVLTPEGAGLLVEPGDPRQLADAVASVIALGPRAREMADAGRQRQIERYSDTAMARGVAAVYDKTLMILSQAPGVFG